AGARAQHDHRLACHQFLEGIDKEAAHGLVAAGYQRLLDALFGEPLLNGLRTQAATKTVEVTVGVLLAPLHPGAGALGPHGAADQLVAEVDGSLLAFFLVTDADAMTFIIVEQWQVA